MTDQARATQDRIDLGNAVFLAAFFIPLVLAAVVGIVGAGISKSMWVALFGVANLLLLSFFANQLYGGSRSFEKTVWAAGGAFLVLAIAIFVLGGGTLSSAFLGFEALMPALFAALVALGPSRDFLRSRRGEQIEIKEQSELLDLSDEPFFVSVEETEAVTLHEQVQEPAVQCSKRMLIIASLIILCGVAGIAWGGYSLYAAGTGIPLILVGLFCVPTGLVLLTAADDWSYLSSSKGYEKAHFANVVRDTQVIRNFTMGAAFVVILLVVIEMVWR